MCNGPSVWLFAPECGEGLKSTAGWLMRVRAVGMTLVQLCAVRLTLMHQKRASSWKRQLFVQKRSKGALFFLSACSDTEHSHQPAMFRAGRNDMVAAFCLAVGRRENKEKNRLHCLRRVQRHWLPVWDEPVNQSSSPYPCACWHFQRDRRFSGFFCLFAHFLHRFVVSHLRIVAFIRPAEHSAPATLLITCLVANYNR